jgi:RIO kinase 1
MLCCDLIHGDLSPYNILAAADGPTIIDFPQVVSAVHSSRAEFFFLRDFDNVVRFLSGFDPSLAPHTADARAIWRAYVSRELTPQFVPPPPPPPRTRAGPIDARAPTIIIADATTGRRRAPLVARRRATLDLRSSRSQRLVVGVDVRSVAGKPSCSGRSPSSRSSPRRAGRSRSGLAVGSEAASTRARQGQQGRPASAARSRGDRSPGARGTSTR